jgi:hypothetical protein
MVFTRVGTYVQRGSKLCFVVVLLADTLIRILQYCPISPCFQHIFAPLHTALRLPSAVCKGACAALRAIARQSCAGCCPDKSKQVQQNLRALLSRQVQTGSAEFARAAVQTRFSKILHHAFMSGISN